MSTLSAWIQATLNGDILSTPALNLDPVRQSRTVWLALLQAYERYPSLPDARWAGLWDRLDGMVSINDRIDGRPVLNHMVGLGGQFAAKLVQHAMGRCDLVHLIPQGKADEPLADHESHRWSMGLLDRLIQTGPLTPQRHHRMASQAWIGVVHQTINRTDLRHEHWRTRLWQDLWLLDARHPPGSNRPWAKIAQRLAAQGPMERPLQRVNPQEPTSSDGVSVPIAAMGTLDVLLDALVDLPASRFNDVLSVAFDHSPWAHGLIRASDARWATRDLWSEQSQLNTLQRFAWVHNHLATYTVLRPPHYDGWSTRLQSLHALHEQALLRETVRNVPVSSSSPSRRRL